MEFEVQLRQVRPGIQALEVHGDLDLDTAPLMGRFLDKVLDDGCQNLIIDFVQAYYIDSTGVSLLLKTWSVLSKRAGRLIVICRVPRIRRTLQIVNLTDVISLAMDEREALELLDAGTPHA